MFVDGLGHMLIRISSVDVDIITSSGLHCLVLNNFDTGSFMFGDMIDLTTSLALLIPTMI